ncbi:MAG: hypothetical protein WDM77_15830 [Steroidobacteraceae bacterium]
MPSSISSSDKAGSELPPYVRSVPRLRWRAVALLALVLVVAAVGAWEVRMRSLGLRTVDIDDGDPYWAVERRKIDAGPRDQVAIVGDSRILFDTSLDAWRQTSGIQPIQLALVGTGALPFLQDLAADKHFAGLVVVGIAEFAFFGITGNTKALTYTHTQSPSQRVGHQIDLLLQRVFAFLDTDYALFSQISQLRVPERPGVSGGYLSPWKISESFADRQGTMWRRFEADAALQRHEALVWDTDVQFFVQLQAAHGPAFPEPVVKPVVDATLQAVEEIRGRGGEVVFVRPPSSGAFLQGERILLPRARIWDRLLRDTHSFGIYFEDYPQMRALQPVEQSHLSAADQKIYTRAYVSVLCQQVSWLKAHGARCAGDSPAELRNTP